MGSNGETLGAIEYQLKCHPDSSTPAVSGVRTLLQYAPDRILVTYIVDAPKAALVLPVPAAPRRSSGLWKSTCFELFLHNPGTEYFEFNFSPSGRWSAYRFSSYREGMQPLPLDEPPSIQVSAETHRYSLSVVLELPRKIAMSFGLSAIIEEQPGVKSYWALSHPQGKPDFHHEDCFVKFE
jgi:hypothetical protein